MQSKKKTDTTGITALYCRLSRDDGADGDSNSVATLKFRRKRSVVITVRIPGRELQLSTFRKLFRHNKRAGLDEPAHTSKSIDSRVKKGKKKSSILTQPFRLVKNTRYVFPALL